MTRHDDRVDPYAQLGRQLVASARSLDAQAEDSAPTVPAGRIDDASRRRTLARWVSGHSVLAVLATGVVAASATAAVVTGLRGTPSAPLSAPTIESPARGDGASPGTYRVAFAPSAGVGTVGWCSTVAVSHEDRLENYGGGSCRAAPTPRRHLAGSGYVGSTGEGMGYFVVDETVGGLRLRSGALVLPRTDPALPQGWRVIVVRSGDPRHGERFDNRTFTRWQLVDRAGAAIGAPDDRLAERPGSSVRDQPSRTVRGPRSPAGAACRIDLAAGAELPGAAADRTVRVLRGRPSPSPGLRGRPFLACGSLSAGDPLLGIVLTVLVDAREPGARPAPLPGMRGPDDGRVVDVPWGFSGGSLGGDDGPQASAQRRGAAWLVVSGDGPAARRALLARATVELGLDRP